MAQAIAELGSSDKTLQALTYIEDEEDEAKRRSTLTQLSRTKGSLALREPKTDRLAGYKKRDLV